MTKVCSKCKVPKDFSEFGAHPAGKAGLQACCKPCYRNYDKARNATTERKRSAKEAILIRKYGIDLELFEFILSEQGNCCRICKRKETEVPFNNGQPWQVDHDHNTGKVRGIICTCCNLGLGKFRDNAATLIGAATYLSL